MKNKKWKPFKELKKEASRMRYFYRNDSVDITGGEPTIYPPILELVRYCSKIGLKPTIITNSFALADMKKCLEFKKAGIEDFLVSIYGLGKSADKTTGVKNTCLKQKKAVQNLNKLKIPIRINVTVHKFTTGQLPDIARFAVKNKAKVMNMIIFNPFYEWSNRKNIRFQERYSNMSVYIKKAIKVLESNGVEANVRFLPLCMLKGYEKNVYGFMQLSYDKNEWDFNSWNNVMKIKPSEKWYKKFALKERIIINHYRKSEKCRKCSVNYICDGFHNQYVKSFGFGEENPYLGTKIINPKFFISEQKKLNSKYKEPDIEIINYLLEDKQLIFNFLGARKFFLFIDKNIGRLGMAIRKYNPDLYFKLKKLKENGAGNRI